jgi:hypothetical protein
MKIKQHTHKITRLVCNAHGEFKIKQNTIESKTSEKVKISIDKDTIHIKGNTSSSKGSFQIAFGNGGGTFVQMGSNNVQCIGINNGITIIGNNRFQVSNKTHEKSTFTLPDNTTFQLNHITNFSHGDIIVEPDCLSSIVLTILNASHGDVRVLEEKEYKCKKVKIVNSSHGDVHVKCTTDKATVTNTSHGDIVGLVAVKNLNIHNTSHGSIKVNHYKSCQVEKNVGNFASTKIVVIDK